MFSFPAIPIALSDRNGKTPLYFDELNAGENSIRPSTSKKSIIVETQTIDRFLEENDIEPSEIKLLKVDVEGAEDLVFKGAKNFLTNFSPKIIFESLNTKNLVASSEILRDLGYKVTHISEGTNFIAIKN